MSGDLDALAAAQGNLSRSSSRFSSSGSESDSGGGSSGGGDIGAAVAAGDVMLYATRGDDATFAKLIKEQQEAGQANAAVRVLTNSIGLIRSFVMLTTVLALSVLRPIIVLLLRAAVRSRKFWANTLQQVSSSQLCSVRAAAHCVQLLRLLLPGTRSCIRFQAMCVLHATVTLSTVCLPDSPSSFSIQRKNTDTCDCPCAVLLICFAPCHHQQAYYDKSKVTPEAVDAYRLPQLVKGWETGA
jgi:hypothetical protein